MGMLLLQSKPACMHAAWHATDELKLGDGLILVFFESARARSPVEFVTLVIIFRGIFI
jgi:hypothetical protein